MKALNDKGFLLAEFSLKTIISIFAILLLVFLLFSIYSIYSDKSDLKKAVAVLNRISEVAGSLTEGENSVGPPLEPRGWAVLYYTSDDDSPSNCFGENCLCMCKKDFFPGGEDQNDFCEGRETGTCKSGDLEYDLSFNQRKVGSIEIEGPTIVELSKEGRKIKLNYES